MNKRIILITEFLDPPYDEGIKKTVYNIFHELDKSYNVKVICRKGFQKENICQVTTNKLFLSRTIRKQIHEFNPHTIIYFPFASATFASYLRLFILGKYAKKSKKVFISLQPKQLKSWQKFLVNFFKPKFAATPSPALHAFWQSLKVKSQLIPLYTNLENFSPVNKEQKTALRKKYNLPEDSFIITHMGHLNPGRNLESLISLQQARKQVIIIGSSSTPKDSIGPDSLKQNLINNGIIIIDQYIEKIEEIYQLSDAYIFPVIQKNSSIGLPLSILEARACGIPVITTDFGSVNHFLGNDYRNIYYSKPENFVKALEQLENEKKKDRQKTGVHKLNEKHLEHIHNMIN